ncbi:hypothetical protein HLH36_15115 [Gluconacetobacter aggeris]|uniref:Transcriptional regulator-like domain-containing protein n=1 Tax=Gluconacetobacter aggeris TaxID=1286186 RepID=A0A7W4NX88_9PROT|nr:DUF6499 domain-containing protein [Gluconacetobacter aggeris]MBB2169661.1 hypothetical protein [Gluconacetobacter aggeris]
MPGGNWRDQKHYERLRDATLAELGWEYLRRSRRYREAQRTWSDLAPGDSQQAVFSRHWGPRFRRRS